MATYKALYKCRLCGERYRPGVYEDDKRVVENHLEELNVGICGTAAVALVGKTKTHRCTDGSLGLADFQGWEMEGQE